MSGNGHCDKVAAAVILGAGSSRRMNGTDKIFAPLAGRPLISYSLTLFEECPAVTAVVVVSPPGKEGNVRTLAEDMGCEKFKGVVAGGKERRDSAAIGLLTAAFFVPCDAAVLIHDAARPFADCPLVRRLLGALDVADGAVPALPPTDTIKKVAAPGDEIVTTLARDELRAVQTPQAFPLARITEAYKKAVGEKWEVTDDAAVMEKAGGRVVTVEGEADNFKITYPSDLARAECLLSRRQDTL
ncbi:MAG: 2-C-methyl-D-erythritol 4-phosphate cytidylyltransferase [Candidatus Zixiibacteriota bacterium]